MNNHSRLRQILWLLLASWAAVWATAALAQEETETVARQYLALYESRDASGLAAYYTDQSVMEDPTGVAIGRTAHFEGEEIVAFLSHAFAGVSTTFASTLSVRSPLAPTSSPTA